MAGIMITGHGHFPSGVLSAVELVAGTSGEIVAVDFEAGQTARELRAAMTAALESLDEDQVLILADLAGGTPFNTAAVLKQEVKGKEIRLLAGASMPMVVEAVFSRAAVGLDELTAMAAQAAAEGLMDADRLEYSGEEPQFEDGL